MSRSFGKGLGLVLLLVGVAGGVAARQGESSTLEVDYYFIRYCMSCDRVLKGLGGIPEQFGPRVRVRTIDCFSSEGRAAAAKYGFVTHGLVIHDSRRGLIFEEKDHGVRAEHAIAVLRRELAP